MNHRLRRFQVASILAAVVLVALFAVIAWWQIRRVDVTVASDALHVTQQVADVVFDREFDDMESRVQTLASNPAFVGYVSQALEAGAAPGAHVDAASIADLLQDRRASAGFDTAAVLDTRGGVIAAASGKSKFQRASSTDELVATAREKMTSTVGLVVVDGHLHLVSVAPLVQSDTLEALLYAANPINAAMARKIGTASGTEAAVVVAGSGNDLHIATSTQGVGTDQVLLDALGESIRSAMNGQPAAVDDGVSGVGMEGGTGYARATAMGGRNRGSALLASLPPQRFAPLHHAILIPLGLLMVLGLLVLLATLAIGWTRWFLPLDELATIAAAASRGNHDVDAPVGGTGPVSQVAVSFNVLQKKIRESRGPGPVPAPTIRTASTSKDAR